jgi:hypothetical protein
VNTPKCRLPSGATAPGPVHPKLAARARQCRTQPLLPPLGEPADVTRDVHLPGAGLLGHAAHLTDDVAGAYHQPPAEFAQRSVEVGQATAQEGGPVGRTETGRAHPVVQHEQGHHLVGRVERATQHRAVVRAQVGGEQGDRDAHHPGPFPVRPRSTRVSRLTDGSGIGKEK